jgi:hypothetical protein
MSFSPFSISPKLHVLTTHTLWLAVLKKRKVEDHGDFILGPVSPKEYKETVAELNGSRTNRVFEFFKVAAPEHVGFAKHHEAAERKAAMLAATDADAGETATSPRTASTRKTGRKNVPAAATTAAAEGRAWKRRGGRPADSPTAAKRTRVMDVETDIVEDVIAAVPLRSATPSVGADKETGGPLLVPLSPKEKDSDDDSDVRIVSSVGEAPRGSSPTAFGVEAPATKANPALPPPAHLAHRLRAPSSPPPPQPQSPKKTTLSLLRKKMKKKRKRPTAATTV